MFVIVRRKVVNRVNHRMMLILEIPEKEQIENLAEKWKV
jgi:hypothetical protein